jgi:hypothetical protein
VVMYTNRTVVATGWDAFGVQKGEHVTADFSHADILYLT